MRYMMLHKYENDLENTPVTLQVLTPVYLILLLVDLFRPIPHFSVIALSLAVTIAVLTIIFLRNKLKLSDYFLLTVVLLLLFYGKSVFRSEVSLLLGLSYSLVGFCLGFLFIQTRWSRHTFRIQFLVVALFLAFSIISTLPQFPFQRLVRKGPLTYLSLICFVAAGHLYLADFFSGKYRPVIWPAVVSLFLSFYGQGRGSILISLGLLCIVLAINVWYVGFYYVESKHNWFKTNRIPLLLAVVLVAIALTILIPYLYRYSHFALYRLSNTGRISLATRFLSELTPEKLLKGFVPSFMNTRGIANTYLWSFATLGIFSVIPLFGLVYALYRLAPTSSLLFFLLVLVAIYFLGEALYPFRYGDTIFIPLVIAGLHADQIFIPGKYDDSFYKTFTENCF